MGCVFGCLVAAGGAFAQAEQPPGPVAGTEPVCADARPDPPPAAPPAGGALWFRGDYLLWKVNGYSVPALVGRIPTQNAELIQAFPSSAITPLFGGGASGVNYDAQSGVRLDSGMWLGEARQFGLSIGFFQLETGRQHFRADSQGQQALGPVLFYDAAYTEEAVLMDGVPGLREGTVTVDANQHLWGAEANAAYALSAGGFLDRFELSAGFRYLQFSEGLQIRGTSQAIPGGALPCG
jgi:hypothetical protein